MSPSQRNRASKVYPNSTDFSHKAFFRTGGLITDVFRNPLVSGLLRNMLCFRCLVVKAILLLFSARGRTGGDTEKCKDMGSTWRSGKDSLLCFRGNGIHGTPDVGELLTTGVYYITDGTNLSVPFYGGLSGIRVVFERCVKRQLRVKDGFLSGTSYTSTFCDELILASRMVDLC